MDRTSWIVIIVCFLLLLGYQPLVQHFYPTPERPAPSARETAPPPADPATPAPAIPGLSPVRPLTPTGETALGAPPAVAAPVPHLGPEVVTVLENDRVRIELTNHGAGIRRATLKEHRSEGEGLVALNRGSPAPVFNLTGWFTHEIVDFEVVEAEGNRVVFRREIQPGLILTRTFFLRDAFTVNVQQTVEASAEAGAVQLPDFELHVGLATSVHLSAGERTYIRIAWSNELGDYSSHSITEFDGFNLLGIPFSRPKVEVTSPAGEPLRWVAVKDQFFVLLLASETVPIRRAIAVRRLLPDLQVPNEPVPDGVDALAQLEGFRVSPGQAVTQDFFIYAGPKEDHQLSALPFAADKAMEFGWMAWISRPMLRLLNFINRYVGNYGVAIIILTIILKSILWPLQSRANMAMKRMSVVAPVMKEIQEKYKDNPQKMNEEMLKLYQNYGLNPLGGCLPLLIQMPLFLGFYYMLLSSIELRHASFLWISDLSMPDTVFQFPFLGINIKLNPMPLIMAATMYWSMHVTPQPQGVNNPAMKIMKFMPLLFLLFCYNFAAALSLYWTVQNLLSIVQIHVNSKKPMPTLEQLKAEAAEKRKKKKALEQRFKKPGKK